MSPRDQPARTFWNGAANEPHEDGAHCADQDYPPPPVETEGTSRHQDPRQQGNQGHDAELNNLIYSESAAAKLPGHQFGDVGVNSDQLNSDANTGDEPPGNNA